MSKNIFQVKQSLTGWYITDGISLYMHKDGSIHPHCGIENFFSSEEEALSVLGQYQQESFKLSKNWYS